MKKRKTLGSLSHLLGKKIVGVNLIGSPTLMLDDGSTVFCVYLRLKKPKKV